MATIGFGIRNVEEPAIACREIARVLRPAGTLVILEFSLPRTPALRSFYLWYFRHILPLIGRVAAGRPILAEENIESRLDIDPAMFHRAYNAVANSIASGVTYALAAGNSTANACNSSPARVASAITVGATTRTDAKASYSNYGTCLDIFAPGVNITSAYHTGGTTSMSGTSMASPHVAGLVARCIDAGPCAGMAPAQIIQKIRADAAARPAGTGFSGDPTMPFGGEQRYYGHLVDSSTY